MMKLFSNVSIYLYIYISIYLTAPTNEFVGFYPIVPNDAINGYRDSPSRSMFRAAFSSLS